MHYPQRVFVAIDDLPETDEILAVDDIDRLFLTHLPQVEPPPALIERILAATVGARRSDHPSPADEQCEALAWKELSPELAREE